MLVLFLSSAIAPAAWGESISSQPLLSSSSHLKQTDVPTRTMKQEVQSAYVEIPNRFDSEIEFHLAAPENLNPGLYEPPTPAIPESPLPETKPLESEETEPSIEEEPFVPAWQIEDLTINFSDAFSNFDQANRIIEPTVTGVLPNGDRLSVTTGLNTFNQPDIRSVLNIPLEVTWTREMGDFTTTVSAGVDLFDQRPIGINASASTSVPLGNQATLSFFVEYEPYKFNATTLNNQVTSLRYGPNLYWQIAPDLSFFSLVRWGIYNDGNREQQSFSRLEQTFGDFSIAANLFNWRYQQDLETTSGYFSPPDFLVANGEIAWQGEVFDWLDCRAAISWGQQRLTGEWTPAYGYRTQCTFQISDSFEMDLGYAFDNVIGQTGDSAFNNRTFTGEIRIQF
ncbi:MAG: hypothetical protein F6K42_29380 [Leptolyngbya sp. SIO1D8]|nr:hypothetical protein [Leptolyngbya sp. SIO1D8]